MKVALDTNHKFVLQGGVSRYIDHLIHGFQTLRLPDFSWVEVNWPVTNYEYTQPMRALKTVYREFVWGRFSGPEQLKRSGADLLHALDFTCITGVRCPQVLSLHDLGYVRVPDRFRAWTRWRAKGRLAQCHRMDKVICISQFTADEAMQLLGLSATRIEVVHLGPGFVDATQDVPAQAPTEKLPNEFMLFVGHLEPNKNLKLLRGVYELAAASGRVLPPLVIVGKRWEGVTHEGAPPKDWVFLGRQPDGVLRYLYERAQAKIFPSRYEGFGMTVLEAMTYGCPVICSPVASLPEVAGTAAYFVEPTPESYLKAVVELTQNSAVREDYRQRGFAQVKRFSWQKCVRETKRVYDSVLK